MRALLLASALAAAAGCAGGPAAPPHRPGEPVNIAMFGAMKTWKGPFTSYLKGVKVQEGFALEPSAGGGWRADADAGNGASNIGVEWDEHRLFDRVVVRFADAAPAPSPDGAELQIWAAHEESKKAGQPVNGSDGPYAGHWAAVGGKPEVQGATWTWRMPSLKGVGFSHTAASFKGGSLKVRALIRNCPSASVAAFEVYGDSTWREVTVHAWAPAETLADGADGVSVYNGLLLESAPSGAPTGFVACMSTGPWRRLRLLATATLGPDLPDRTVVTLRGTGGGVSFLVDDVLRDGLMAVPATQTIVFAEPYTGARPADKTIRERVAAMPEQTFDHAMRNIPPKERNKWLALGPGCNVNKFAVLPDGNFFPRHDGDLHIEFATGDPADFERREPQRVEEDWLPVLIAEWEEGPLKWKQEYCCCPLDRELPEDKWKGDETTALVTRITVKNTAAEPRTGRAFIRFPRKKAREQVTLDDSLLTIHGNPIARLDAGGAEAKLDGHTLSLDLPAEPGAARSVTLVVLGPGRDFEAPESSGRFKALTWDDAHRWVVDYWTGRVAAGASFRVPDERLNRIWKSLLVHQSMWGDEDPGNGAFRPNVAAFVYGPVGNESSQMIKALDMFGDHRMAQRYLDPMIAQQGTDDLNARVTAGDGALVGYWSGYVFNTGFILWNGANHYRFTRDKEWLAKAAPHWIKACDWIAAQRCTTMITDARGRKALGYGFFPPCGLEDVQTWWFWTMTNAYMAAGMRHAAEVLAEIGRPEAARIAQEAAAYQAEVTAAVREATIRCPVVKLQNGTWVPYVPKHLQQRGRPEGHYEAELSALHLASTDLFDSADPLITATLDFHEDEVYLTEAPDHTPILSFSKIRDNWFNLGGYGKTQPYLLHTAVTYVRRDEPKHALRTFFNNLAAQLWHDINAMPEHICWRGAADCKTYEEAMALQQFRTLLVHEEKGELWLAPAASRSWLADGREIAVERAPTFFGPVTYTIRSEAAKGRIVATIEPPKRNPPSVIRLRLRHPEEKPIRSVTLNGKPHAEFDPAKEWIVLKEPADRIEVVAAY